MNIVEWIIWGIACVFVMWGVIAFLVEVFNLRPFPKGPEALFPPAIRKLITCLQTLGLATGVIITAVTNISKFHLLWFVPLYHLFGTLWIDWIYGWFVTRSFRRYCREEET